MPGDLDDLLGSAPDLGEASSQPAHARIEQWLMAAIHDGVLVAGDKLPREELLAASLGVSRMTLRQALATLDGLDVIVRVPGRQGGTFAAEPRIVCDLTGLAGFTEQMRRAVESLPGSLGGILTVNVQFDPRSKKFVQVS